MTKESQVSPAGVVKPPPPSQHVDADRKARIAASKASGRKPYCIWDAEGADSWHSSSREVQDAWDAYVQREVDIWNEREGTYDRGAHLYHQWTPPLKFSQWLAQAYPSPEPRASIAKGADHDLTERLRENGFDEAAELIEELRFGRLYRAGHHLHQKATSWGWPDDGEGAFEYVQRITYEQAFAEGLKRGRSGGGEIISTTCNIIIKIAVVIGVVCLLLAL